MDRGSLTKECNDLILILRQDTNTNSYENELVRKSNTICMRYSLVCSTFNKKYVESKYDVEELEKSPVSEDSSSYCKLQCVNRKENVLIKGEKKENVSMNIELKGISKNESYIIWAYANSNQIEINDKKFLFVKLENGSAGKMLINFDLPEKKGIYELEIFYAPSVFELIQNNQYLKYKVVSAQRYTLKVE